MRDYDDCPRCNSFHRESFSPENYWDDNGRHLVIDQLHSHEAGDRCPLCDEWTVVWTRRFTVTDGGRVIATVPSLASAQAVVAAEAPTARYERDDAWESERRLRQAEGWD